MEKRNFTDALKLTGVMMALSGSVALAAVTADALANGKYRNAIGYGAGLAGIVGGITYTIRRGRELRTRY